MRTFGHRLSLTAALAALVAGVVVVVAPAAEAATATVIDVPAAQPTIQAAIDAAVGGDTVVVAPGTYFEHIDFKGKAIEVRSSAGPATTVIDGGGTDHVVSFRSNEPRAAVLRGFTVTHGGGGPGVGLGIFVQPGSPTIIGNVVTANTTSPGHGAGLGIYVDGGSPLIQANRIVGNTGASIGGGIAVRGSTNPEIVANLIEGNAADWGGGLDVDTGTLRDNVIRANTASHLGGGFTGSNVLAVGNLVVDNAAGDSGGGVAWSAGTSGTASFVNNTMTGNTAPAGSAFLVYSAGLQLTNNVLAGPPGSTAVLCQNDAGAGTVFSHNDVSNATASPYDGCPDPTGTAGNISADPRLAAGDYRPAPDSPVVDAGDNAAASLPATDQAGGPRITDGDGDGTAVVDIGALESPPAAVAGDRYHPLTPARILDTRTGTGAPVAPLGPLAPMTLQVSGQGGVPATGVSAVALNVTVTGPTAESWLTAWPSGLAWPGAANLNFTAGQTVANLVVVKVSADGRIDLVNFAGATDVVADVAGWYGPAADGSRYFGLAPARILDTRLGVGAPASPVPAGGVLALQVTGHAGVPASGVTAVVLNVTVTNTAAAGWLTAWPAGDPLPLASNVNYLAGATVPNLVVVRLGAGGVVDLYASGGADVVADVAGYYGTGGAPGGAGYTAVVPARVLDTRIALGAPAAKLGPSQTMTVTLAGQGGVPASGVSSVVLNLTAVGPSSPGWLTVWPAGEPMPVASNLNFAAGQTVPNLVTVRLGAAGAVNLFSSGGPLDIVGDVAGWFTG